MRHVGRHVARLVATEFGTLEAVMNSDPKAIAAIPGIGDEIATAVTHFFKEQRNRHVIERLQDAGVEIQAIPRRDKQPLQGKTFVFTGTLARFTRDQAREEVEALGGRATSSVSGETDYVVIGAQPGRKLEDARQHHIKRIDEDAFIALITDAKGT
jgi:DNA ligase (NAD+)